MKVSLNSIRGLNKRYGCADDIAPNGIDDLVEKIGAQLGAVEEVTDIGKKYQGAVIVKIVKCVAHKDSDHLNICTIDDGGNTPSVKRDENDFVQVVCGAPNVREGLIVVWLPPGMTVPKSYDTEPFVLEAREIRGVTSNGMLASARELALGEDHEGILEIEEDVKPGILFADHYELTGDYIIDIENKMFTHRPDCFGFLGVSRELAGIQHMAFNSPEWYTPQPKFPGIETDELPLEVKNEIPELVPRFTAITMRDVTVGPSPVWLQIELAKVGMKSINNIVDYSNFFMLETAQPIHIYDYDKVKALSNDDRVTLTVRYPKPDEKISLLNGKTIEPDVKTMMVATSQKLICLGGAMGGIETEVDETTKNIIIEAANWDMYTMRRTSMTYGIFTDAVTRFTKGQSPLQNLAVVAKIVDEIRKNAGGKVASEIIDSNSLSPEVLQRNSLHPKIGVNSKFINDRLGLDLTGGEIQKLLKNVEFNLPEVGDDSKTASLEIVAPFWRTDIEIPEDVVEEVGRLYGFDHLPLDLPKRDLTPAKRDELLTFKQRIRGILARAGANEVLTYNFVHGNLLDKVGQDRKLAFELSNALSPDLQYYRLDVLPSLLDKVHANIKAGCDEFALFEMNKAHSKLHADDDEGLPTEFNMLAFVYAANDKLNLPGAPYYQARVYLDYLAKQLGIELVYTPAQEMDYPVFKPYDVSRTALVTVKDTDITLGLIGEFKRSVIKNLKLPNRSAGFEVGTKELLQAAKSSASYQPLPKFPKVTQDISLKVPSTVSFAELSNFVQQNLQAPDHTIASFTPLDIYQGEDNKHKNVTLRFSIASYERTLTAEEVNKMLDTVAISAQKALAAERV